jgi:hypothetical protein
MTEADKIELHNKMLHSVSTAAKYNRVWTDYLNPWIENLLSGFIFLSYYWLIRRSYRYWPGLLSFFFKNVSHKYICKTAQNILWLIAK